MSQELVSMIVTKCYSRNPGILDDLPRLFRPSSKVKLVDDAKNPVSPEYWMTKLKGIKGPLTRLFYTDGKGGGALINRDTINGDDAGSSGSSDVESDSDMSDCSSSVDSWTSSSYYSSVRSSEGRESDPISNAEKTLRKLQTELKIAEIQRDQERVNSLKSEVIPRLEALSIRIINEEFDANSRLGSGQGQQDITNPHTSENRTAVIGDRNQMDTTNSQGERDPPIKDDLPIPREKRHYGGRRGRETFEADEDALHSSRYPVRPNLKGLPYIEIDKERWYEKGDQRPKYEEELYEGHGRGYGEEYQVKTRMETCYMPSRERVVATAKTLGVGETSSRFSTSILRPVPGIIAGSSEEITRVANDAKLRRAGASTLPNPRRGPRGELIEGMVQKLLKDREDLSNPIFLWPTGLRLRRKKMVQTIDPSHNTTAQHTSSSGTAADGARMPSSEPNKVPQATSQSDDFSVRLVLDDVDEDLRTIKPHWTKNLAGKLLYKAAEESSKIDVEASMKRDNIKTNGVSGHNLVASPSSRNTSEIRKFRLFNAAERLLRTFVPAGYESAIVVRKYWGAIYRIQHDEVRPATSLNLPLAILICFSE